MNPELPKQTSLVHKSLFIVTLATHNTPAQDANKLAVDDKMATTADEMVAT